jgi:hypothetical protein
LNVDTLVGGQLPLLTLMTTTRAVPGSMDRRESQNVPE